MNRTENRRFKTFSLHFSFQYMYKNIEAMSTLPNMPSYVFYSGSCDQFMLGL